MTGLVAFVDHIALEFYPIIASPLEYKTHYEKEANRRSFETNGNFK